MAAGLWTTLRQLELRLPFPFHRHFLPQSTLAKDRRSDPQVGNTANKGMRTVYKAYWPNPVTPRIRARSMVVAARMGILSTVEKEFQRTEVTTDSACDRDCLFGLIAHLPLVASPSAIASTSLCEALAAPTTNKPDGGFSVAAAARYARGTFPSRVHHAHRISVNGE